MPVITTLISAISVGPNPFLSKSDRECWETHLSSLDSKYLRNTSYCSQTLASLYDLHKSPPDSGCRGLFDVAANYSLEDVLLLSKIASLLLIEILKNKKESCRGHFWLCLSQMTFSFNKCRNDVIWFRNNIKRSLSVSALWCDSTIIILITSRCLWLDICFPL